MEIDEVKERLKKHCTIYESQEINPTNSIEESWIGKVAWQEPNEKQPIDSKGKLMIPLATLYLDPSKYIPEELSQYRLITIYMSEDIWDNFNKNDLKDYFEIRTYNNLDNLEKCDYTSDKIKPLPLITTESDNDYPFWDDGGIPNDLFEIILKMEEEKNVDYGEDIFEDNACTHKLGGYPSFCQSGFWFGNGYNYVMQISSDSKADFNIIDSGNFYFYYNPEKNDWKVYSDFY